MVFFLCLCKNKKLLSQQQQNLFYLETTHKNSEHEVNIYVASCVISGVLQPEGQLIPQERYDENTGGFKTAIYFKLQYSLKPVIDQ